MSARKPQLDGLRFFAVLGVIVWHAWLPGPLPLIGVVNWGGLGVELFFVLSGFLITGILLDCRGRADAGEGSRMFFLRTFYVRRFLRIFPLYYGVLLVLVIVNFAHVRELAVWLFTYTANIFWASHDWEGAGRTGHFWTLAVEEQFYLFWPCLLLFVPRRRLLPLLMVVMISLGPLYRLYVVHKYGLSDEPREIFTLGVIDTLGIGALLAFAVRTFPAATLRFWLSYVLLPLGLAAYIAVLVLPDEGISGQAGYVLGATAVALVFAWLVAGAARGFSGVFGRVLELRPLVYVGMISYGVYVFHNFVIVAAVHGAPRLGLAYHPQGFVSFVVVSGLTVMVAACSWHFFERPINGLKDRFAYRGGRVEGEPTHAVAVNAADPSSRVRALVPKVAGSRVLTVVPVRAPATPQADRNAAKKRPS